MIFTSRRLTKALFPLATALAIILHTTAPAAANDSTAALAMGSLRLTVSSEVEMRTEDLYISTKRVEVNYRFFNRSDRAVQTVIAFPLPAEPDPANEGENDAIPSAKPGNPYGFHAWADGQPVALRLLRQAVLDGRDQTARLTALGLPLDPYAPATREAVARLDARHRADLTLKGLLRAGAPAWALQPIYVWTQVFPVAREVVVRQVYVPSVGEAAETYLDQGDPSERANFARSFCPDAAVRASVARFKAVHGRAEPDQRIDYVLHTGANWAAPINRFHLTLDKGDARTLLSVCLDGLRKTSPTRFELERRDFRPKGDLHILLLRDE